MARRRPTEPTVNPARGVALVVVAVLAGLFLLRNGIDTSEVVTSSNGEEASADDTDGAADSGADDGETDGTTDDTTEDTTPTTRPPAEVPTIVLNGSSVTGAAGTFSQVLAAAGYQLTNPEGANADAGVPSTQVLYAEGYEAEAVAVAAAIGAPELAPLPLGATPPGPIDGASVVVVLGPDLADSPPSTTGDTTETTVA